MRTIQELKEIYKNTDDDKIFSLIEYIYILSLAAGQSIFPERSSIMPVGVVKRLQKKDKVAIHFV